MDYLYWPFSHDFPEDQGIHLAYDISKRNRAIEQINRLFKYTDREVFYPNYNLLACATGSFRVSESDLQNLVANKNFNVQEQLLV